jgi:4-diphosphocytidyl-2-C-methyl-D-erythritol kinase
MIVFPPAKINLGLNVVRKRDDGYHDLQSILVPISLRDALEIIVDPTLPDGEVVLTRSGLPVPGSADQDLCLKAVAAVGRLRPLPGIRLHLHKVIPMGAGLGGGSSDGTHTLLLLNNLLYLKLSAAGLHSLALGLGSDCPFFLEPGPQLITGRGERTSPVQLDLRGLWLVIVNPAIHVSTAAVFRSCTPSGKEIEAGSLFDALPLETLDARFPNTLEEAVFSMHPEVAAIKARLKEAGAMHAAMSGSGSTVYGIFRTRPTAFVWPADHQQWVLQW